STPDPFPPAFALTVIVPLLVMPALTTLPESLTPDASGPEAEIEPPCETVKPPLTLLLLKISIPTPNWPLTAFALIDPLFVTPPPTLLPLKMAIAATLVPPLVVNMPGVIVPAFVTEPVTVEF
ncbi:MAG: hypothetical protein JO094_07485, partial [Hyphomicrobiales bacterium]|nr:hypothetical protein [Hyphomicrobiales bacterium]